MQLPAVRRGLRAIRPHVPELLYLPVFRLHRGYMELFSRLADLGDKGHIRRTGVPYLPPAHLRYRVHGSTNVDSFLAIGKGAAEAVMSAAERAGKDTGAIGNILDFGCGCGRTIIWLRERAGDANIYGTDIDTAAMAWCGENIDFAQFSQNQALPPLAYESGTFDMIYALSVFTHFPEREQFLWLEELRRIARPGAAVALSVHGDHDMQILPRRHLAEVERSGFLWLNGNSYHTEDYIRRRWSEYFSVVEYVPRGMGNQDLAVLRVPG